jgi:hypothetical protein
MRNFFERRDFGSEEDARAVCGLDFRRGFEAEIPRRLEETAEVGA